MIGSTYSFLRKMQSTKFPCLLKYLIILFGIPSHSSKLIPFFLLLDSPPRFLIPQLSLMIFHSQNLSYFFQCPELEAYF